MSAGQGISKWQVVRVGELAASDISDMLALFQRNYDNVNLDKFHDDLAKKDFVVMVRDHEGRVCGFANLAELDHWFDGQPHRLIFSGDTIVDPTYWGANSLLDGCLALLAARAVHNGDTPTYWLLTTKGHRPYRLLKLYFKRYWPSGEEAVCANELQPLCDSAGTELFRDQYCVETGVKRAGPLEEKPSGKLATVSDRDARRADVEFFLSRVPDCRIGDELVCLAWFSPENMTAYSQKFFAPDRIAKI